jgi:hypothetical protein
MKPQELKERLWILARAAGALQTVIVAPINLSVAGQFVDEFNVSGEEYSDFTRFEGQITSQDLMEFLKWIEKWIDESQKGSTDRGIGASNPAVQTHHDADSDLCKGRIEKWEAEHYSD